MNCKSCDFSKMMKQYNICEKIHSLVDVFCGKQFKNETEIRESGSSLMSEIAFMGRRVYTEEYRKSLHRAAIKLAEFIFEKTSDNFWLAPHLDPGFEPIE